MTAPLTPLAASLPATVPFVGPAKQGRDRGAAFRARLRAHASFFGPPPPAIHLRMFRRRLRNPATLPPV